MPDMNGLDLAQAIRERSHLAGATLLLISSADRREDAERSRAVGVAGYSVKPIRQSELLNAIIAALDQRSLCTATTATGKIAALGRAPRPLRVLLAEDGLVNQKLAVRLLEKRGHLVQTAANGRLALETLQRAEFDAVLMDVEMPEMDGVEATAAIRNEERRTGRHIPVIAMTAHAMRGDREKYLAAGMDDYVSKPLEPAELFRAVESLAAGAAVDAPPGPWVHSPVQ
jgi:CheY-like chemotaxis protein